MLEQRAGVPILRFGSLRQAGFIHGVSTRLGGVSEPPYDSLNLSLMVRDDPERVRENRARFARAMGVAAERVVDARQVHGCDVLVVDSEFSLPPEPPAVDIQITDRPDWLLALRFADCVPIVMAHPGRRAAAVVHAGWRGTQAGAAAVAVRALQERFGADPKGLIVGIGPSIGPCCYEVGEEVAAQFSDEPAVVLRQGERRPHLDLWAANRLALQRAGVPTEQVEVAHLCTRCRVDLFYSHRAEGFPSGRFTATIGLT